MKQELLKDQSGTLYFTPYVDNLASVASSATVTVQKPDDTDVVTSQSCTINSTTGEISYTLTSGNLNELGENWKADFTYTIGGVTYYQTILFDVVLHKLAITVVDSDIYKEQSEFREKGESVTGTVTSATSTTLVDNNLKVYLDNHWNGSEVTAQNPSTGAEQTRQVTDFAQSTGTLTVSPAWTSTPDSTYQYIIRRGYQKKIETAFEEMMFDIRSKGYRPALILESSELHVPNVKKTLALICRDMIQAPEDKYDMLAKHYEEQYKGYMDRLVLQYDTDESGTIEGSERNKDISNYRLKR